MMFMKSSFVKNLANSKSVAAFLANEESLATALFKLLQKHTSVKLPAQKNLANLRVTCTSLKVNMKEQ